MGTVYNTNIITDGLIGCWDAANRRSYPGAGDAWTDIVGGNNADLDNFDSGFFELGHGGSLAYDGTDSVATNSSIEKAASCSFCCWASTPTIGEGGMAAQPMLFNAGNDGSGPDLFFAYGKFLWNTWDGNANPFGDRPASVEDGSFHYYVITNESTSNAKLYYDGAYHSSATYKNASVHDVIMIGGTTSGYRWNGNIANFAIYNKILTAAEVSQNYEATKSRFVPRITKSGMLANWDAGDPKSYNGGTTWKDTANHYDGTLENDDDGSLTFDSANGGSLDFDGTDDYVGPIAIGDHSSTARSVIIWAAADSYAQSSNDEFSVFNSTSDKFSASLGLSNHYGYFYFKSKMTHTSAYQWGIASTSLVAGSWHCWAVTINASDEIVAVYQDGESKTSGSSNGFYFRDDTYIGARMNGSTVEGSWNGKIGTVRLYTKTLSAAEILDNYNKTKARFGH